MRPATAFETPQFPLIPDTEARYYANVSNDLVIQGEDYEKCENHVVIPASLFSIMKDILKVDPATDAFLYLAREGEYFIFGLAWSATEYTDLWLYTERSLPEWLQAVTA